MDKRTAWLALGLGGAAAAIVGAAVAINLNYQHNGDNASNISGALNIDNGDLKINWERYPTYEVELSDTYMDGMPTPPSAKMHKVGCATV